jgi:hypothetical protein
MIPKLNDIPASPPTAPAAPVESAEAARGGKKTIQIPPARGDTVALSVLAKLLAKARELPEVRREWVERVKSEISAGTYDQTGKLDTALSRLLDEWTES